MLDTARGRHSRRLGCLSSHVLRSHCNFESKQANSITLFGRRDATVKHDTFFIALLPASVRDNGCKIRCMYTILVGLCLSWPPAYSCLIVNDPKIKVGVGI